MYINILVWCSYDMRCDAYSSVRVPKMVALHRNLYIIPYKYNIYIYIMHYVTGTWPINALYKKKWLKKETLVVL